MVVLVDVVDELVGVEVVVLVIVLVAVVARRQRRFLVVPAQTYETFFTTRVVPAPAHLLPKISGTGRACAGKATQASRTTTAPNPNARTFTVTSTAVGEACDKAPQFRLFWRDLAR